MKVLERFSSRDRHGRADRRSLVVVFVWRIALLGVIVAGLLALGTIGLAVAEGVDPWYAFRWEMIVTCLSFL